MDQVRNDVWANVWQCGFQQQTTHLGWKPNPIGIDDVLRRAICKSSRNKRLSCKRGIQIKAFYNYFAKHYPSINSEDFIS